ncbi:MAG: cytochrome c biogenesis protein CcdA [Desulfobacterales bacterium]
MAGLLSFFSPCILPLIPAYFSFITGFSLEELTSEHAAGVRRKVILSTLLYVAGFTTVFVLLGASASFLGRFVQAYSQEIRIAGGALIILLGIHLTGLIKIPALNYEKRVQVSRKPLHWLGTFLVGMAFGAGWSPCIGPLLGSILIMAGNQDTVGQGMLLLTVYSAGLALPFILISCFINYLLKFLKKASRTLAYVHIVAGILLIFLGIALMTDKLTIPV